MDLAFLTAFIMLFEMVCVIMVIAYLFSRSPFFQEILDHKPSLKTYIFLIILFGAVSIYGMTSGVNYFGAVVNIRDLGPIIGGLSCGPVVGIGAGIIGALYRLSVGGANVYAAALGPLIAGICSGAIYYFNKKTLVSTKSAILITILIESGVSALAIAVRMFEGQTTQVVTILMNVAFPMIAMTAVAAGIFSFVIYNLIRERAVQYEKERLEQEMAKKETELNIAAEIQKSFLPDILPHFDKFELAGKSLPAKEVGGDFFDVMPLELIPFSKNQLGIMIADVAGKGVPAAIFMALSRIVIRMSAFWFKNCQDAISFANPVITRDSKTGMFVTLFLAILDNEAMTVTYVNAGHNPPLVFRANPQKVEDLKSTGMAIGILEDVEYTQETIQVYPGDLIILYTDGVTEAINPEMEEYGISRLINTIQENIDSSVQDIAEKILTSVAKFSGSQPQFDDITLLLIKVTNTPDMEKQ